MNTGKKVPIISLPVIKNKLTAGMLCDGEMWYGGGIRVAQVNNGKNVIVAYDGDYLFLCVVMLYIWPK